MSENGRSSLRNTLEILGLDSVTVHNNLLPEQLIEHTLTKGQGVLADNGALSIQTGAFTGRSPKDRFIVEDDLTREAVDWNDINMPISNGNFQALKRELAEYLVGKEIYAKDVCACADPAYQLNIRVLSEYPWSAQFVDNMFITLTDEQRQDFSPDWTVLCAPGFVTDPSTRGTRQGNFAIINFTDQMILIGGTGYTGEIKKGIFSVLNFMLPKKKDVLSMHCSANVGYDGDTAVFFGLSGTGKTTLSADPSRRLIGDDEHGWSENGVFNFEGGCYAKCIDLTEEQEPDIYRAIKHGAILENIKFHPGSRTPDFSDATITQNTRVSYPLQHIVNAQPGSRGSHPRNIFFLTCDAFGVLPPISKLTPAQAMYHFISGYTAKVAGTEEGVTEPQTTFSACFGAPFLPLHPTHYARMLGKLMREHEVDVWLVNTGWTGGPYGTGSRIKLRYTRAMIAAALNGSLAQVSFGEHPIMKLNIPESCPHVPTELLDPIGTWEDPDAYVAKATSLAQAFVSNFAQYEAQASQEILSGAPMSAEGVSG